jgi:hypothetical protein
MTSSTSDRRHTWALAELNLPENMIWYFSSDYDSDQQAICEDVSALLMAICKVRLMSFP